LPPLPPCYWLDADVIDAAAWHRGLAAGTLDTKLDAGSDLNIFTFIDVVNGVMREKRYLEPTTRRVRVIMQELLSNVARHVPDRHARVHVTLREDYMRGVVIDVGDNGSGIRSGSTITVPGLIPDDVVDRYTERLLAGEREHGLLLVSRLASGFHETPRSWRTTNHVGCDVIEPQPRSSVLTKNKRVGLVRIEYSTPKVLWIGPEESYVRYYSANSLDRFLSAAERGWLPVLAPYFGPVHGTSHLAVEVSGYDLPTEVGSFWEEVLAAIAAFFPDRMTQQRVVLLAPQADWSLRSQAEEWAQAHELPWFDSEAAASSYLAAQTAG
jgi:anti-sigma regulatory factor (Ser/Thr protein kinase)